MAGFLNNLGTGAYEIKRADLVDVNELGRIAWGKSKWRTMGSVLSEIVCGYRMNLEYDNRGIILVHRHGGQEHWGMEGGVDALSEFMAYIINDGFRRAASKCVSGAGGDARTEREGHYEAY